MEHPIKLDTVMSEWAFVYIKGSQVIISKKNDVSNSKRSGKNTPEFHLIPDYTITHIYVEKINSITRSISKFISLIYFSIKITIKEKLAKNRGHLCSGNTIVPFIENCKIQMNQH